MKIEYKKGYSFKSDSNGNVRCSVVINDKHIFNAQEVSKTKPELVTTHYYKKVYYNKNDKEEDINEEIRGYECWDSNRQVFIIPISEKEYKHQTIHSTKHI